MSKTMWKILRKRGINNVPVRKISRSTKRRLEMRFIVAIILAFSLRGCELCPAAEIDFERLADAVKLEENSVKFPYGISFVKNGVRLGYKEPKARRRCIVTCKRVWRVWDAAGRTETYLIALSRVYCPKNAQSWHNNVKSIYEKQSRQNTSVVR